MGLQGIVKIPGRPGDYVFFVTFGKRQADHQFDEGITAEGVLRWQSQPKQRLTDPDIQDFITHEEDRNSIYLFLRTAVKRSGVVLPYTYLGRLKYLIHDRDREKPVYFTWQVLDWPIPPNVQQRIGLGFEGPPSITERNQSITQPPSRRLIHVPIPSKASPRTGVPTPAYVMRVQRDYAAQDAKNRNLGLAGELNQSTAESDTSGFECRSSSN